MVNKILPFRADLKRLGELKHSRHTALLWGSKRRAGRRRSWPSLIALDCAGLPAPAFAKWIRRSMLGSEAQSGFNPLFRLAIYPGARAGRDRAPRHCGATGTLNAGASASFRTCKTATASSASTTRALAKSPAAVAKKNVNEGYRMFCKWPLRRTAPAAVRPMERS